MRRLVFYRVLGTLLLFLTCMVTVVEALEESDEVLNYDGISITEGDVAEYLSERLLPEAFESALSRSGAVAQAVGNIFIIRKAARTAREKGLVSRSHDLWLAQAAPDRYAVDQLIAFEVDRRMAAIDWTALAREEYLLELGQLGAGKEVAVSHILISSKDRSFAELVSLVAAVDAALQNGRAFEDVAKEMSDDPSAERNSGSLGYLRRGQTDPAFEAMAFEMEDINAISPPTLTSFGVHFIRFEGARQTEAATFDERRESLIAKLKKRQEREIRPTALEPLRQPVVPMLAELDEATLAARLLELLTDT